MVDDVDIVSVKREMERGPQSNPIHPAGIPLSTVAVPVYSKRERRKGGANEKN